MVTMLHEAESIIWSFMVMVMVNALSSVADLYYFILHQSLSQSFLLTFFPS